VVLIVFKLGAAAKPPVAAVGELVAGEVPLGDRAHLVVGVVVAVAASTKRLGRQKRRSIDGGRGGAARTGR
jgi:hypothetical protein